MSKKKRLKSQNWAWLISILIIISFVLWNSRSSAEQRFIDKAVEGSLPPEATLSEGIMYAQEKIPDSPVGQAIALENQYLQGSPKELVKKAQKILSFAKLRKTTLQRGQFKILLLGNNVNQNTLNSWCKDIQKKLASTKPYDQISSQFQIDCGTLPFTVKGVANNNRAAEAWMLLIAFAKKEELKYDYIVVLQNSDDRSFVIPTVGAIVYFKEYKNNKNVKLNEFIHEFAHLQAGLADEYESPKDIEATNAILAKLNSPIRVKDQLDINKQSGLIDPPNCVKAAQCPDGWFRGCAWVSSGVCRPSEYSIMRDHISTTLFNNESSERIIAASNGLKITTGKGILG